MSGPVVVRSLRELDALVAERVMGWELIRRYTPPRWYNPKGAPRENMPTECPPYSADIAAAWAVVEKLVGRALRLCTTMGGGYRVTFDDTVWVGEDGWRVSNAPGDHRVFVHESVAATAPLAICIAALKAVGVEVELRLGEGA